MEIPIQMFGFVESKGERLDAMLCRDLDRPNEAMIQWIGSKLQKAGGIVMKMSEVRKGYIKLQPLIFYIPDDGGGLFAPSHIENYEELVKTTAELTLKSNSLVGAWSNPNGNGGKVAFSVPRPTRVKARKLRSWSAFKLWASEKHSEGKFVNFRGHGSNSFSLTSALHRAGCSRSERFCYEIMPQFQAIAESLLDTRFGRGDPEDFSVALGLAQHHGLPTPLLDWTASPYVAAFFAFSDALENLTVRPNATHVRIYAISEAISRTASLQVSLTAPGRHVSYLSIVPRKNPRLLAQQGRFLLTNVVDLEAFLCDVERRIGIDLVTAVDVPIASAIEALEDLHFMGLSAASMFPGLDGICRMMKHEMLFKQKRPRP